MKKYKNDVIIIAIILVVIAVVFCIVQFGFTHRGNTVKVVINNEIKQEFNLNENRVYTIKTDKGFNRLIIKNGKASVTSADCPDKVCVHSKSISDVGESIICVPHKVVVEVAADE